MLPRERIGDCAPGFTCARPFVIEISHRSRKQRRRLGLLLSAGAMALGAACASTDQPLRSDLESASTEVHQCAGWFTRLADAVADSGVQDAEAYKIPGFPYLRVNRLLASFRNRAGNDPIAFAAWERELRDLDARARG